MYTDLLGKTRCKVNLHMHTTLSDGLLSPADAVKRYWERGYDALAITDHWSFGNAAEYNGMTILTGGEYNTLHSNAARGVYHIVGVGMRNAPVLSKDMPPQKIIDAIHKVGGLAILAHPAWSLNTPEQIRALHGIDATEIYNSVSGMHHSDRPDSGIIVDQLGLEEIFFPLLAADDAHYYDGDECYAWIMVEAEDNDRSFLIPAIRKGNFYATQGPEVHMWREGDEMVLRCSPARRIVFLSNSVWNERVFTGTDLTEARYKFSKSETYVRAEVTDANGKRAWTNCVRIPEHATKKGIL